MVEVFNINEDICIGLLHLKFYAIEQNLMSKREIELKGKCYLINQLLKREAKIIYDENGKPYVENEKINISISHSHDKLVIIVNRKDATGIDIELVRNKVLNIKHKFLSINESEDAENDIEKLMIYWAAKETLYKIYGLKEVNFIEHLFVKPFTKCNLGKLIGEINLPNLKENFQLNYVFADGYVLVYVLNKINRC